MPEVDALSAAEAAIASAFPSHQGVGLRVLGEGWDYTSYLVGEDLVLRVPRPRTAARRLVEEARILELIAGKLPLETPRMQLLGGRVPVAGIYPMVQGVPARLDAMSGPLLGRFLRALHATSLKGQRPRWFRWAGVGHGWESGLRHFCTSALQTLGPHLEGHLLSALDRRLRSFLGDPRNFRFEVRLIHGDLSSEHLLADPKTGRLRAVVDFGDAGLGDPAYDVRPEWTRWYGRVSPGFALRQRFYRRVEPLHAALYAVETQDAARLAAAIERLRADVES